MSKTKQTARIIGWVVNEMRPFDMQAEERAIAAWRALDTFTSLSAAQLRQERRALVEMQDMIARALDAIA